MPIRSGQQRIILIMALLLMVPLLGGLSGCSGARAQLRHKAKALETVNTLVEGYWNALRWEFPEKAVECLEDGPDRGLLWEYLLSRQGKASIGEYTIYQVELAENLETGTANIKYELMVKNEGVVREKRVVQTWFLGADGRWYLEFTPDELSRLDAE